MNECINCGSSQTIPVWEEVEDAGETHPDYVGCTNCSTMVRPHLVPEEEKRSFGQARLSKHEIGRLKTGNQHSSELTVIDWQVVKAAAIHYGVRDWTSKVDGSLTSSENVGLMEEYGSRNKETSLRMLKSPGEYRSES